MPGNNALVDENIQIIIRNADLVDIAEIRRFTQWQHTLKLNDIASWQLDLPTRDFQSYGIDCSCGIKFYRDNELILDGPISQKGIKQTLSAGEEKTSIVGGCDNAYLASRICYPVVTGPIFDKGLGYWQFKVQRSAVGIKSDIITGNKDWQEYEVPFVVEDAFGFVEGNTIAWSNQWGYFENWTQINTQTGGQDPTKGNFPHSALYTLSGVDDSTNTLTVDVPSQDLIVGGEDVGELLAPPIVFSEGTVIQTSGGLVDDPNYLGYDTRTGVADKVVKELVYFNAGNGACSDYLGTRAIKYLEIAKPTTQGSVITMNSRGENLLVQVQNACLSGAINFKITQVGGELVFSTFVGNDLSTEGNLVFSVESGNLSDYEYSYGPPSANMIWGCGPMTGPEKQMLPSGNVKSIDEFGRWETWLNSGNANASDSTTQVMANMVAANNLALAAAIINGDLTLSIRETDQVRYPRDFQIGDRVRVMVGNMPVDEIVTMVTYSVPESTSAASSTLNAALSRKESRLMQGLKQNTRLLQQISMT